MKKKRFKVYFTNDICSCFNVTEKQIKNIVKQYTNVEKVVEIKKNLLTKEESYRIIRV